MSGGLTASGPERNVPKGGVYPDLVERDRATDTDISIAILIVVLVLVAGIVWFVNSPAAVEVDAAETVDDNLTAIVNSCGGDLTVDVYQDDSLVRIRVLDHRFRIRLGGGDCQDGVPIPLSVPLGDRLLVDDATDQEIDVMVIDS